MKEMPAKARIAQAPTPEASRILSEREKRAWLRLIRTPQIGGVTFWELLAHFGSAETALKALPEFAVRGGFSPRSIPSMNAINRELEQAAATDMTLVAAGESGYPPLLARAEVPPPLLYIKGQANRVWDRPPLAVVGSRQASAAGLKFAAEISAALGLRGFAIVSGLAREVDAAAHRAALPFATCAVLPGGLDAIYPREHTTLAEEIAKNGLLISECAPGFARAQDFPRRNRLISGSCLGVVIVEATERSGSLITARLAAEQNREVFAVPGHPYEPRAAGTNRLLKEGAVLTTGPDDIEQALQPILATWKASIGDRDYDLDAQDGPAKTAPPSSPAKELPENLDMMSEAAKEVLPLLSFSPIDVDDLCRLSGLEARHVHAALLALDLAGRIERRGLRQVALRP